MEQQFKKRAIIPFIIFIGFIVVSINSLFKGIEHHETWRIVSASIGGFISVGMAGLLVYANYKNGKAASKA